MKILIVNTSDIEGGAAKAAFRLHKALLYQGIDSQMLVQHKFSDEYTIIGPNSKVEKFINLVRPSIDQIPVIFYKGRTKTLFSPAWKGNKKIIQKINEINPDIVHLHWICGGMIKIEDIAKIKAPIVWSLHDNWAFTGGCHYNENCDAFIDNCGNCKILVSNKENDLSRKIFKRKQKTYSKIQNLTIIGLSKWINEYSKNSALLKVKKHINLPNPIDTNIFKPFDKEKARELWNLPKNKKLILFGAINATGDPRKGFKQLSEALQKLNKTSKIEFVVFGSSKPKNTPNLGLKTNYVGKLRDEVSLMTLYNAVDVMVVPSLQENLSNVIMESLACALPVVGFDIGGNRDMIEHKKNGYLAKPFNTTDLKNGIEWILNNESYQRLCQNAREKVVKEFDSKVVAKKYIAIYEQILLK